MLQNRQLQARSLFPHNFLMTDGTFSLGLTIHLFSGRESFLLSAAPKDRLICVEPLLSRITTLGAALDGDTKSWRGAASLGFRSFVVIPTIAGTMIRGWKLFSPFAAGPLRKTGEKDKSCSI